MPAPEPIVYLVEDASSESAAARVLIEQSGMPFHVQAEPEGVQPGQRPTGPALITQQGTWVGLDEIKAYLSIPAESLRASA